MPTANEILQDRTILHATYLERFKRDLGERIVAMLNDEVEPEVLAKLQARLDRIATRGYDKGLHSTQRLADLQAALSGIIHEFSKTTYRGVRDELVAFAKEEAKWQVASLRRAIPREIVVDLTVPSPVQLRAIVTEGPINGALLKDWFAKFEAKTLENVTKAVNVGISSGETTAQIAARVRGTPAAAYADGAFNGSRVEAQTLAQTATAHTAQRARSITAQENADIIKGEKWSATLDSRTCPVCAPLDGKVMPLGEGPRPPAHPNCRCASVPVLKSWRDLGYNVGDLPKGTRASMDGQAPADLTFNEWLKQQPPGRVARVLGSKDAAKAFLAGDVSLGQFSTSTGSPLSWKKVMALSE